MDWVEVAVKLDNQYLSRNNVCASARGQNMSESEWNRNCLIVEICSTLREALVAGFDKDEKARYLSKIYL